jgi:hypothetical protein
VTDETEPHDETGAEEAAAEAEYGGGEEPDDEAAVAAAGEHDVSDAATAGLPVATQLGNADDAEQPVDDGD